MKKSLYLLVLVVLIAFAGGFYFYHSLSQQDSEPLTTNSFAKSTKQPLQKIKPEPKIGQTKLIGYIQDFRDPTKIDYAPLTHIIFSFVHPTKDGDVLFTSKNALGNLRHIVNTAYQHDTKVMLAIGGWYHMNGGESYDYFKDAIRNPTSRKNLVNELINIVERENLDGIDIDFEHPRSKEDAENLTVFSKELSDKLHAKKKELSVAVYAKIHAVTLTEVSFVTYEPEMFHFVDHVNIMAYDGHWDDGYHAANLSPYLFTEKIVDYWGDLFENLNLSKEKLVLGVPFYAQPEDMTKKQVSYGAIVAGDPTNSAKDTVSMNGTTYYFNGSQMMEKKTNLVLGNGFGGIMIWELGLDATGKYSLTSKIQRK